MRKHVHSSIFLIRLTFFKLKSPIITVTLKTNKDVIKRKYQMELKGIIVSFGTKRVARFSFVRDLSNQYVNTWIAVSAKLIVNPRIDLGTFA